MARQTWSYSRANLLNYCERQYFFAYLAGARRNSRDPRRQELALLGKLKPVSVWIGDVVHAAIAGYLRDLLGGRSIDVEVMCAAARALAERQWAFSRTGRYREATSRDADLDFAALFEHEYGVALTSGALDEALSGITTALCNFVEIAEDQRLQDALSASRQVWIEPPVFGPGATTFALNGLTVLVKVDLGILDRHGELTIYDWKTGSTATNAYRDQMECYLMWSDLALGHPLDHATATLVNVETYRVETIRLTPAGKVVRIREIERSAAHMAGLIDPDTGVAQIEDFNYASHVRICDRCPYRRVCQDW